MSEATDREPRYLVVQRFHGDGWYAIKADSKGARRETLDAIAQDDDFFGMVAENPKRKWIAWGMSVGAACEALDAKNVGVPTPNAKVTEHYITQPEPEPPTSPLTPQQAFEQEVINELARRVGKEPIAVEPIPAEKRRVVWADTPPPRPVTFPKPLSNRMPAIGENWVQITRWPPPFTLDGMPVVRVASSDGETVTVKAHAGSYSETRRTYGLAEFRQGFVHETWKWETLPRDGEETKDSATPTNDLVVGDVWHAKTAPLRVTITNVGDNWVVYRHDAGGTNQRRIEDFLNQFNHTEVAAKK